MRQRRIILFCSLFALWLLLPLAGCQQKKEESSVTVETNDAKHEITWETTDKDRDD